MKVQYEQGWDVYRYSNETNYPWYQDDQGLRCDTNGSIESRWDLWNKMNFSSASLTVDTSDPMSLSHRIYHSDDGMGTWSDEWFSASNLSSMRDTRWVKIVTTINTTTELFVRDISFEGATYARSPEGYRPGNSFGIVVADARNILIDTCTVRGNRIGISMTNTAEIQVADCDITGNTMNGVRFEDSSDVSMFNNTLMNNQIGIVIDADQQSLNNTFYWNTIQNNTWYGVYVSGNDNTFHNNTVMANGDYGIISYSGDRNYYVYNEIFRNGDYAIYLYDSDNNTIHHNNIENNGGVSSQGYDNTGYNNWDNGVDEGNYWADWDGSGTYSINGGASAEDNHPIDNRTKNTAPLRISEFNTMIVVSGFVLIASVFFRRKIPMDRSGTSIPHPINH